jgi:hypothetical protein
MAASKSSNWVVHQFEIHQAVWAAGKKIEVKGYEVRSATVAAAT